MRKKLRKAASEKPPRDSSKLHRGRETENEPRDLAEPIAGKAEQGKFPPWPHILKIAAPHNRNTPHGQVLGLSYTTNIRKRWNTV